MSDVATKSDLDCVSVLQFDQGPLPPALTAAHYVEILYVLRHQAGVFVRSSRSGRRGCAANCYREAACQYCIW